MPLEALVEARAGRKDRVEERHRDHDDSDDHARAGPAPPHQHMLFEVDRLVLARPLVFVPNVQLRDRTDLRQLVVRGGFFDQLTRDGAVLD